MTKFGRFVSDVGVSNLREELRARGVSVTGTAIYLWISGRHQPSAEKRRAIVKIARGRIEEADLSGTKKRLDCEL
jgi:hypothetical protein